MNMSFALTEKQFLDGSKTVTRRIGWWRLKPGDIVTAVRKGMGLKKGERVHVLGQFRVVSVTKEPLRAICTSKYKDGETAREGFPKLSPMEFGLMFCSEMACYPDTLVNRIEFQKIP